MSDHLDSLAAFASMFGAACLGAFVSARLLSQKRFSDQTLDVFRLTISMLAVLTSVLLALMLNSARSTKESNSEHVHALATEIILLDRLLRGLGEQGGEAREHLKDYIGIVLREAELLNSDPQAEAALDAVGNSLRGIKVTDEQMLARWNDARQMYRDVERDRWVALDAAGGTIPTPMIVVLITLLSVIFAGLGYRSAGDPIATVWLLAASLLFSAVLFIIVDMDRPGGGYINVSYEPFHRALGLMRQ